MNKSMNPDDWMRPKGYSNVICATGQLIFIAGQIGWDEKEEFQTDDFVEQTGQALRNIKACLEVAGADPQHLVRLTWFVIDKHEYLSQIEQVGRTYREVFGRCFPAMSLVQVAGLIEPRARVEIEATAVLPGSK
ncbi:MAG TPA: RidA family protein [Rhizobiales bacterium]|nr:RidA family protein [Hyphomicrobiales bacterium]